MIDTRMAGILHTPRSECHRVFQNHVVEHSLDDGFGVQKPIGSQPRQGFSGENKVRYEFSREEAYTPINFGLEPTLKSDALRRAQHALNLGERVEQYAFQHDRLEIDQDPQPGWVVMLHNEARNGDGISSANLIQGSVSVESSDLTYTRDLQDSSGRHAYLDMYIKRGDGFESVGYADSAGAVEVKVSPNGALTVLTS